MKTIDVDINEIVTKSITHAKNLSFHFARIIFDESKLFELFTNFSFNYLVKLVNFLINFIF